MNEVIMSEKVQPWEEMLLGLIQCHFAGQFIPLPLPPKIWARSTPRASYQPNGIPGHLGSMAKPGPGPTAAPPLVHAPAPVSKRRCRASGPPGRHPTELQGREGEGALANPRKGVLAAAPRFVGRKIKLAIINKSYSIPRRLRYSSKLMKSSFSRSMSA
jgi:hypothetical protein